MAASRTVLCMKWGTLFAADYVNVLFNACRAHVGGPFRFVCLTDDAAGLLPGIEALPIPGIGLAPDEWFLPGIWPKLAIFAADLHGLRGRCLFIDLDMMVFAGVGDMFDCGPGLVTIDWGPWMKRPPEGGHAVATGVLSFDLGAQAQILDAFRADRHAAMARFANEQDFVAAHGRDIGFFPPGWILSFKRHLRRSVGIDLFVPPRPPPAGTRILAFHGRPRPADMIRPGAGFWDVFPHMGHGQVRWMAEYWTGHGGTLPGAPPGCRRQGG